MKGLNIKIFALQPKKTQTVRPNGGAPNHSSHLAPQDSQLYNEVQFNAYDSIDRVGL